MERRTTIDEPSMQGPALGLLLAVGCLLLLVVFFVTFVVPRGIDDVLRAYPSPEVHAGIFELAIPEGLQVPTRNRRLSHGDFDGDGVPDELEVEYFHMEPLHRESTSGMVYVRCGCTGEVLLAHAVTTPLCNAAWVGDVDRNGTDDVYIHDRDDSRDWERRSLFGRGLRRAE